MCMSLMIAIALTSFDPEVVTPALPAPEDVKAYEKARATVGRDAESHINLALWCEAHGLQSEKLKHLALAVLLKPSQETARGLLGLVADHGKWLRPEAISERVRNDETTTRLLAEYNTKRASLKNSAGAHWKLALWCEEKGLKGEATAHFTVVTRLDPSRNEAWKRLGCRKHNGRWMTEWQIVAERAEAERRRNAESHWKPRLLKLRHDLSSSDKARRMAAEDALIQLSDPLAVSSVWAVFVDGGANYQVKAVQILGQINEAAASQALARLAVFARSREVRRAATEILRRRDPRDFVTLLIKWLRDPVRYSVRPADDAGNPAELLVEGKQADVRRVYELPNDVNRILRNAPPRLFPASVPFDPFSPQNLWLAAGGGLGPGTTLSPQAIQALTTRPQNAPTILSRQAGAIVPQTPSPATIAVTSALDAAAQRDLMLGIFVQAEMQEAIAIGQEQLRNDVQSVEALQAQVAQVNGATLSVLTAVTDQDFGEAPDSWRKWWTDQQGYAYTEASTPLIKPTFTEFVENPALQIRLNTPHNSCFGAGTPVRTLSGPRPIEELRVGDQVLAQDIKTGQLYFEPILAVYHNKPAATLRIRFEGGAIVATGIHRFWKAGKGWIMARELKVGDRVRIVGGTARVEEIVNDVIQPVFNLEVASRGSFFVGPQGALVHDNTLVEAVLQPFDATNELASATEASR